MQSPAAKDIQSSGSSESGNGDDRIGIENIKAVKSITDQEAEDISGDSLGDSTVTEDKKESPGIGGGSIEEQEVNLFEIDIEPGGLSRIRLQSNDSSDSSTSEDSSTSSSSTGGSNQSDIIIYNLLFKSCSFAPQLLRKKFLERRTVNSLPAYYSILICLLWYIPESVINRLWLYFQYSLCSTCRSLFSVLS